MSTTPSRVKDRYDRTAVLGRGGMGVVYRAFDNELRRDVALKTILDSSDPAALELFRRECAVLASLNHPNVIDIYDVGELEEEGQRCPYFVMPLLEGSTLDTLIKDAPQRLTVERTVEIISQACRGLHAAHEHGLIHRDLKPSNLFVLKDDSVKIIDFGVASFAGGTTSGGARGTLLYMSPEQVQHKAATAQSDIYALGVTCFEALTRRHPFSGCPTEDLARAILQDAPPSASELNPAVSASLSQVIHAAMAKQPFRRYQNAREFAETLQKGFYNQPIERFDPERLLPRIQRAEKAFDEGEFDFAAEILGEIEAEGHLHPTIRPLARRIDQALRGKTVTQLFDAAKRRYSEEEYALALQKLQEVLQFDPAHPEAHALKAEIEGKRGAQQIENWFALARQHIDNGAFAPARQALQNVIQLTPSHSTALRLLTDIDRREEEYLRTRQQKEEVYSAALEFWRKGEVTAAVSNLEKVLDLDRRSPDKIAPERSAAYQDLYNEVRSESNAIKASYDEARKHIANYNLEAATEICNKWLAKYPGHALFQALTFDIDGASRQQLSTDIARIDGELEKEFDLDRRVEIIQAGLAKHPGESHFEKLLKAATAKRDIVGGIVTKARSFEERGAFADALTQWEILRSVFSQYPGIDIEVDRVIKRREQKARSETKAKWISEIDAVLDKGDSNKALALVREAMLEFPDDPELQPLQQLAQQGLERAGEADKLLEEATEMTRQNRLAEGMEVLRRAHRLDQGNARVRAALLDVLVAQASTELDHDWATAEDLVREATALDATNARLRSLQSLLADRKHEAVVSLHLSRARAFQVAKDLEHAVAEVEQGLFAYPEEARLLQLKNALSRAMEETVRGRPQPNAPVGGAERAVETPAERAALDSLLERAQKLSKTSGPPKTAAQSKASQAAPPAPPDDLFPTLSLPGGALPPSGPAKPPAAPPSDLTATIAMSDAATIVAASPAAKTPPPAAKTPATKTPAPPPAKPAAGTRKPSPLSDWRYIAAAAVVLIMAGYVFTRIRTKAPEPPPVAKKFEAKVPVQITPENARVVVDSQDLGTVRELALSEGSHEIDFVLDGYKSQHLTVPVDAKGATIPPVTLEPLTAFLRLGMSNGKAELNGQPVVNKSGIFSQDLAPGEYTLKLLQDKALATISFKVTAGAMPEVAEVKASNMNVNAVTVLGKRTRVYGQGAANFIEIPDLAPGPQVITIGEGGSTQLQVEIGPAPSLQVIVTDPEKVNLLITSNEDGANVMIDGTNAGAIRNGKFLTTRKPGSYTVSVEKAGFSGSPAEKVILEAGKAQRARNFPLVRNAAILALSDAADAHVMVDGVDKGTVPASGILEVSVDPGRHKFSLRKEGFETVESEHEFRAGEKLARPASELLRPLGKIMLTLNPRTARSVATRRGGGQPVTLQEGANTLQPGDYDVTTTATGFGNNTRAFTVRRGETASLAITLSAVAAEKQAPAPVRQVTGLVKDLTGTWASGEDNWYTYSQEGFSLLSLNPEGNASFEMQRKKPSGKFKGLFAKEKAIWVAFYKDPKNHLLFELENDKLTVTEFTGNGKKQREKISVDKEADHIEVQLMPERVVVDVGKGHVSVAPDKSLQGGKFGFKGPAAIRDFVFKPASH